MGFQAVTAYGGERRFPWFLLLSLLLHGALLIWWRVTPTRVSRADPATMLEVRLLPPERPVPFVVPPRAERKTGRAGSRPAPRAAAAVALPAAPEATPPVPADMPAPAVPEEPAAPTMAERARAMAGAADQTLRKENPERKGLFTLPLNTPMARFIRALEAAGKPRATSVTTIRTADGQTITKVTTGAGSYCVYGRKPNANPSNWGTALDYGYTTATCPQ